MFTRGRQQTTQAGTTTSLVSCDFIADLILNIVLRNIEDAPSVLSKICLKSGKLFMRDAAFALLSDNLSVCQCLESRDYKHCVPKLWKTFQTSSEVFGQIIRSPKCLISSLA